MLLLLRVRLLGGGEEGRVRLRMRVTGAKSARELEQGVVGAREVKVVHRVRAVSRRLRNV